MSKVSRYLLKLMKVVLVNKTIILRVLYGFSSAITTA